MPRGRPQSEARRNRILEAAARCFVRRGFHRATMQDICAEAEMSPGALYRYFASKDALIEAIAESEQRDLEPVFRALEKTDDFVATLTELTREAIELGADPEYGRLAIEVAAEASRNARVAVILARTEDALHAAIARAIAAGQRAGQVDPALDAEGLAHAVLALWDGLSTRSALTDAAATGAREIVATLVARLLHPSRT